MDTIELKSLENISNEVLDKIVELYGDNPQYRVLDERKKTVFNKPREYFLFANHSDREYVEWTFIWIGNNLWQFTYSNALCKTKPQWRNPLELLNEQLNPKS